MKIVLELFSDIFFLLGGGEGGVRGARKGVGGYSKSEEGGVFKIRGGGGVLLGEGRADRGARRMSAGNLGGPNLSLFLGRNSHQEQFLSYFQSSYQKTQYLPLCLLSGTFKG